MRTVREASWTYAEIDYHGLSIPPSRLVNYLGSLGDERRIFGSIYEHQGYLPIMTEGDLYNAQDRMAFITAVAQKYHKKMTEDKAYMESVIGEIATWRNAT
ncbi:hypothetical protein D9M69_510870 [compost metagenome]